jgi:peptidoglycan/xylan/chitin deacetylase (PgdA/CDA1 family)
MSRTTILTAGFEAIYHSGAARFLAPRWGGVGVIFCLHHVTPGGGLQTGFAPNSNLEITPEFLSDIITLVKQLGYELISMSAAVDRLKAGIFDNRFAVFTLDDGYKDNQLHALPVFQKHQCPFTVYASPRIVEGICELWWRGLEAVIATASHLDVKIGEEVFASDIISDAAKWKAWKTLAPKLQAMPELAQRDTIKNLADRYSVDLHAICRNTAMTWQELRDISANPLVTIGAHTLNHYNLSKLPEVDARFEIIESGRVIAAQLAKPVEHFAYPYGNRDAAGPREFGIAAEAGYRSSVVTRLGTLQPQHSHHLQALPRIMISGRFQNTRYIEALISGVPGRLANGLKQLNVD